MKRFIKQLPENCRHDINKFFDILESMQQPKVPWYIRFLSSTYYWLTIIALGALIIWCFINL